MTCGIRSTGAMSCLLQGLTAALQVNFVWIAVFAGGLSISANRTSLRCARQVTFDFISGRRGPGLCRIRRVVARHESCVCVFPDAHSQFFTRSPS
jgi:hypothetical protein